MPSPLPELHFDLGFAPKAGAAVPVAPGIQRVTAPNRSPYTFTGTNSFLIGDDPVAVLDPGPDREDHLAALQVAIGDRRVSAIILTHTHIDHSALARKLVARTRAPLWFAGRHRLSRPRRLFEINPIALSCDWSLRPDRILEDGELLDLGSVTLKVITTPGHCANHIALGVVQTPYVFTGDHVMGWNSTLVPVPDGSMANYFMSLDKLIAAPWAHYLPAHGGPITDGPGYAARLKVHREGRNRQVLEVLTKGGHTSGELRAIIYEGAPLASLPAAAMTLKAHLEYLEDKGLIRSRWALGGRVYSLA